jgi:hypothetical protein
MVYANFMANLNPLKYCFHGQHVKPRTAFRTLPGTKTKRQVCSDCYDKIMADRKEKRGRTVRQPRQHP